jgi:hypothetical protein
MLFLTDLSKDFSNMSRSHYQTLLLHSKIHGTNFPPFSLVVRSLTSTLDMLHCLTGYCLRWDGDTVALHDENGKLIYQTKSPETATKWGEFSTKPYEDMYSAMEPIVKAFLEAKTKLKVKSNIISKPFEKDS